MEIAVFIQNIQEERAEVALYIFTNQTNSNLNQSIILSNNRCSSSHNNNNNNNNNSIITSFYIRYSFNDVNNPNRNRMGIQERFSQTDRALEEVPTWPNVSVTTPDWTIMSSTERASSNLTDRQISNRPSQISAGHSRGGPVRGLQIQAEIPNPA